MTPLARAILDALAAQPSGLYRGSLAGKVGTTKLDETLATLARAGLVEAIGRAPTLWRRK